MSLTYCLFNIHYAIKQTPGPKKKKALADQVLADQPDQTPSPHSQRSDIQNFRYVEGSRDTFTGSQHCARYSLQLSARLPWK